MSQFDHWMRFHVGDYLADTMHLSTYQHGIYVLLIMHYFKRGELPDDDRALARIAKTEVMNFRRYGGPVMALFQRAENGASRHTRIDAERERARGLSETRSNVGKQGASKRWRMANANGADGNSHPARGGARATPEPELQESPPVTPRKRGERGRGSRNGFTDTTTEQLDAEAADPRREGPALAVVAGRSHRG